MNDKVRIEPSEVQHFAQLADHWWDKEGQLKTLHAINPLRVRWLQEYTPIQGLSILDVGCGGGILSESLAHMGAEVLGIDPTKEAIEVAKRHAQQGSIDNLQYQQTTIDNLLPIHANRFDLITCMEMLEHVPDPRAVVQACGQLVKPGGYVFFSTINRNVKAFALAIVAAEYLLNMIPRGTHSYAKLIRPSTLADFAQQSSLQLLGFKGIAYQPLWRRFYLTEDMSVNYLMATQRIHPS
jgi:2-polyprenyl-6-hydroxyphenyl methylase/3-demethylubiquinone-9 3-methyltransferase